MMDFVIIDQQETLARLIRRVDCRIHHLQDPLSSYQFIESTKPELVFVSHEVLDGDAPFYIACLSGLIPDRPIVLTGSGLDDDTILDCVAAGAKGFLDLSDAEQFVEKLIVGVLQGEAWISRRLVAKLLERIRSNYRTTALESRA